MKCKGRHGEFAITLCGGESRRRTNSACLPELTTIMTWPETFMQSCHARGFSLYGLH